MQLTIAEQRWTHRGCNFPSLVHQTLLIVPIVDRTSTNSGCMVVEWMPSSWKNDLTCWEMRAYSCKLVLRQRMWAVAMIRLPASCQTWNSCTSQTPSTCSQHHHNNLNTYGRRAFSVAGPTVWNSLPDFIRTRPSVRTVSDGCLKRTCSLDTSAFSALEVLTITALYKFTYLLTYRCLQSIRRSMKTCYINAVCDVMSCGRQATQISPMRYRSC